MKNIFSKKVIIIVSALFIITLLNNGLAIEGQGTHLKLVTAQNLNNIDEWVKVIEFPDRDEWQKPDEIMQSLNLKPGDVIADIGAGDGYFTKRFAKAVSPGGQALGLEITSSKVEYMRKDAERSGFNSYKALLIEFDDPGLKPGSVDVVFMCNTYHHLANRVEYLKRLSKSLKKNGRIVIVDFYKKPMPVGPSSLGHKVSKEVVLEEFQEAGYKLQHDKDLLPYQYYLEFGL
jgi:ubiquinone/menaquinone biosynthesis C-methylase UbiE